MFGNNKLQRVFLLLVFVVTIVVLLSLTLNAYSQEADAKKKVEIISDPTSIKVAAQNGTASISILLWSNSNVTANIYATDLVQTGETPIVIPSIGSIIKVQPNQNVSITTNQLTRIEYSVVVPEGQEPGNYKGKIEIMAGGEPTKIDVEVIVPPNLGILWWLLYGALASAGWVFVNHWRDNQTEYDKNVLEAEAKFSKAKNEIPEQERTPALNQAKERAKKEADDRPWRWLGDKNKWIEEKTLEYFVQILGCKYPKLKDAWIELMKVKNTHPKQRAFLRAITVGTGAILVALLSAQQFLQVNPNFFDAVGGGIFLAFAYGFGAHQAMEHIIEQSVKSVKKAGES